MVTLTKSERIDIRTNPAIKGLLQRAASTAHKSVSEFLLDAGLSAAQETLAGRNLFPLDDASWEAFQTALDRPPQEKPRLRRLLAEASVFEKQTTG